MHDVTAFTKMTGLMDFNAIAHNVEYPDSSRKRYNGGNLYANYSCPVILVKAGEMLKCKINSTYKKSAYAGMTSWCRTGISSGLNSPGHPSCLLSFLLASRGLCRALRRRFFLLLFAVFLFRRFSELELLDLS